MLTRTDESTGDEGSVASSNFFTDLDRTGTPGMKSTASQAAAGQTSSGKVPSEYVALLMAAQASQAKADRAVADLAALKRSLVELPRSIESRRQEFERARQTMEKLEAEMAEARQLVPAKQAEAAKAIEDAANAQRALAHALIQDETNLDAAQIQELTHHGRPAAVEASAPAKAPAPAAPGTRRNPASAPYFAAGKAASAAVAPRVAGTVTAPSLTNSSDASDAKGNSDQDGDVVEYMVDRDLLCPSCGAPLRGVAEKRCPGCRLGLSVPVMQSVAPGLFDAQRSVWAIRYSAFFAIALSAFLLYSVLSSDWPHRPPKGFGGGSESHRAIASPWSKIFGVPVAIPGMAVYVGIIVISFFTRLGLRDSTRRRAWIALCITGATTAAAGVWFIVMQAFILKAFCPYCLVVDVMGILTGVVVLLKAPLGRREPLPANAIGAISFPRSLNLKVLGMGLAVAFAFIGAHVAANISKPKLEAHQVKQPTNKDDGGLMMGGLETATPKKDSTLKSKDKASVIEKPGTKPAPSVTKPKSTTPDPEEKEGGLLVPGLEVKAPEKPKDKKNE